jgi:hypothetical protein
MDKMQSFKTNDNVTLKYFDTGNADEGEDEKPWLILVRRFFMLLPRGICSFALHFSWQFIALSLRNSGPEMFVFLLLYVSGEISIYNRHDP